MVVMWLLRLAVEWITGLLEGRLGVRRCLMVLMHVRLLLLLVGNLTLHHLLLSIWQSTGRSWTSHLSTVLPLPVALIDLMRLGRMAIGCHASSIIILVMCLVGGLMITLGKDRLIG